MRTIGAILTGGRSRRMGTDKAGYDFGGKTMLEWVIAAAAPTVDDLVAVGGPDRSLPVLPDPADAMPGPLAGLVAALQTGADQVLLLAVDQPYVRTQTLAHLVAAAADLAVVPIEDGVRQVTCALYPANLGDVAAAEAAAHGSIQTMLDRAAFTPVVETEWSGWGEDGRSWLSIDDPEAVAAALDRYGPPHHPA